MLIGKVLSGLVHEFLKHNRTAKKKKSVVWFQVNNFPPPKDHVLNQNTSVAVSEAPSVYNTYVRTLSKLFHRSLFPNLFPNGYSMKYAS